MTAVLPALCEYNDPPPIVMGYSQSENVVHELSRRVAQLLETCKNRGLFANDKQWRRRTRACVETTAALVCCADAEIAWFGDVGGLLGDVGRFERLGESLSTGMDRSFSIHWICLSIMAIRPVLTGNELLRTTASDIVDSIQTFQGQEGTLDEQALKNAKKIDDYFSDAYTCLFGLALFRAPDLTEDEVEGSLITELERINTEAQAGPLMLVDHHCNFLLRHLDQITHGITGQLPGIQSRFPPRAIPLGQVIYGSSQISNNITRTGTPELVFLCPKIPGLSRGRECRRKPKDNYVLSSPRRCHQSGQPFAATTVVAPAGSPRWRWAWLHSRTLLPCTQATIIHVFVANVPICALYRHLSGHYIRLALVQALTRDTDNPP